MWAWFATTKLGRWLIGLGAVLAAIVAALGIGWWKGRKSQADADKARDAAKQVKQAQSAQETYQAANEAAERVGKVAAEQPTPDVASRADFDNTGFDQ